MEAMYGSTPTKGRILLATPPLEDPNFDRTVIYVLEHHDEGALGLVLNRPSPEELGDALRAWAEMQSDPSLVFVGGPVEPDALIAIARVREPLPPLAEDDDENETHLAPLSGDLASADLAADPIDVVDTISAPARVPRLRRMGAGPARRRDRSRRLARARPRPHRPLHRHARRPLARACCAANPAAWRGWPRRPTTSPPTEPGPDAGPLARPGVA